MRTEGGPKVVVATLRVAADTPHLQFRVLRNPERSAPHVIAMPSRRVPRASSEISCRGTHLHSWSHRYCRSLCDHNVRLFVDFLRRARMNSRESSIRARQLGPNRWNQSPRAWACVSCVSEEVLPASVYGFEGNGNADEKRPHHRDFLSAGAHKCCN
jgi:hypothetical protein